MNLLRLALKNIARSPFRSGLILFCVALVAISVLWATLIVQGARENIRLSLEDMQRLEADIVVVPREGAFAYTQLGNPEFIRLLDDLAAIPGIQAISPQLRLMTVKDSPLCAVPELFVVALDNETDFTVLPWLSGHFISDLGYGEAIAGSSVSASSGGQAIRLAGLELSVLGQLSPTGTSLDQSLYVSFETAQELARSYQEQAEVKLDVTVNNIPVIMVKVMPGVGSHAVSNRILASIPGVTAFDSASFFWSGQVQMIRLLNRAPALFAIIWGLSVVCIGLVFTVAVNERRREIGVLRVLGSTYAFVFRSILAEGLILALGGAVPGMILGSLVRVLYGDDIVRSVGIPLPSLSPLALLALALACLAVALLSVTLAAWFPAWRICRQEPAVALRG